MYTVGNANSLLKYLGNPQVDYKTIHVAGTSGKTSTSYYISELLNRSGLQTDLNVSNYVNSIKDSGVKFLSLS
jgi:dihydrofolate synthase/folylpolyglutamate synthase